MSEMDSERITVAEACRITGYSERYFQQLASRVKWAVRPSGPRGRIYFDRAAFDRWWAGNGVGVEKWRPSTKGARTTGAGTGTKAATSASPLKQHLARLLKSA